MKTNKIIFSCLCWLSGFFLLSGCEKENTLEYEEIPGVYFDGAIRSYSFYEKPGTLVDTLKLPVLITGQARDYDRAIRLEVVADSNTTADQEMYELLEGSVRKGEYDGLALVVLKYADTLEKEVRKLNVRIVETEDFKELRLGQNKCVITFSAKIIKPDNWDAWLLYYFGKAYSTAWWKFIMEATGKNSLPYYPTHKDQEKWWMSGDELLANYWLVKKALNEYNANPVNNPPLLHDDGPYANQKVEMPEI